LNGISGGKGGYPKYPKESWDRLFMEMKKRKLLFEMLKFGNYIDNEKFVDIVTDFIAKKMMIGKTHTEMYESFGTINLLTPSQEEKLLMEMGWIISDLTPEKRQQIDKDMGWISKA
jgi:hypothetical protein